MHFTSRMAHVTTLDSAIAALRGMLSIQRLSIDHTRHLSLASAKVMRRTCPKRGGKAVLNASHGQGGCHGCCRIRPRRHGGSFIYSTNLVFEIYDCSPSINHHFNTPGNLAVHAARIRGNYICAGLSHILFLAAKNLRNSYPGIRKRRQLNIDTALLPPCPAHYNYLAPKFCKRLKPLFWSKALPYRSRQLWQPPNLPFR